MYEIWLVMNILWEIALGLWPWLALYALLGGGLVALAWRQPWPLWRRALPGTAALAAGAALLAFLAIPTAVRSSLQEMGYWVDWANLASLALGFGVAVMALAWPAGVLLRRNIIQR